jgi:hypothetical protein
MHAVAGPCHAQRKETGMTNPSIPGVDSESWTCQGCGVLFIGQRPAGDRCADCRAAAGPFESEREARESEAVQAVWTAWRAGPGVGKMAAPNLAMLAAACEAAGVQVGAYDQRILAWLSGWEPQTCAVIAGLITRAAAGGAA